VENDRIAEIGYYDDLSRRQRAVPVPWIDRGTVAVFPGLVFFGSRLSNDTLLTAISLLCVALLVVGNDGRAQSTSPPYPSPNIEGLFAVGVPSLGSLMFASA
jgi:hypothetical protein